MKKIKLTVVYLPEGEENEYSSPSWNGPLNSFERVVFTKEEYNAHIENLLNKAYDAGILHDKLSLSFDNPKNRYMSQLNLSI